MGEFHVRRRDLASMNSPIAADGHGCRIWPTKSIVAEILVAQIPPGSASKAFRNILNGSFSCSNRGAGISV